MVVLLNEGTETIATASRSGFRCFTAVNEFRQCVQSEVLVEEIPITVTREDSVHARNFIEHNSVLHLRRPEGN